MSEAGQKALAEKAAKLGVERFVIDDGWFGAAQERSRRPGRLVCESAEVSERPETGDRPRTRLGMDFGIWVEPEMVNPDSDLYRKHPEWAMNFPGRPRTEARNQLLLNLARDDVKDYVFQWLDQLVTNNDIAFLKWDYNRNWSEPGCGCGRPRGPEKDLGSVCSQSLRHSRSAASEASETGNRIVLRRGVARRSWYHAPDR